MINSDRFPNLYVLGFAKSGTSHLCTVLSSSKDVFIPNEKEPHYFSHDLLSAEYRISLKDYLEYYNNAHVKYRMDGSISYVYSKVAVKKILECSTDPIFIIMVRNPFERMMSHYRFNVRNMVETRSFESAIRNAEGFSRNWLYDYVQMSDYSTQISRLLETTGLGVKLKLIDYDEYLFNPSEVVQKLSVFLEIEVPISDQLRKKVNVGNVPKVELINRILNVDKPWKGVVKKCLPREFRRNMKKYIHNVNVSDVKVRCEQTGYTRELQKNMNVEFKQFRETYSELYL